MIGTLTGLVGLAKGIYELLKDGVILTAIAEALMVIGFIGWFILLIYVFFAAISDKDLDPPKDLGRFGFAIFITTLVAFVSRLVAWVIEQLFDVFNVRRLDPIDAAFMLWGVVCVLIFIGYMIDKMIDAAAKDGIASPNIPLEEERIIIRPGDKNFKIPSA